MTKLYILVALTKKQKTFEDMLWVNKFTVKLLKQMHL